MNSKKIKQLLPLFFIFVLFTTTTFAQEVKKIDIKRSQEIDSILIKKKIYNSEHPTLGYRIQLYYGNEKISYAFKDRFEKAFPAQKVDIEFDNPDWKTMVGNFRTRITADSAIVAIKKQFLGAVVVNAPLKLE